MDVCAFIKVKVNVAEISLNANCTQFGNVWLNIIDIYPEPTYLVLVVKKSWH